MLFSICLLTGTKIKTITISFLFPTFSKCRMTSNGHGTFSTNWCSTFKLCSSLNFLPLDMSYIDIILGVECLNTRGWIQSDFELLMMNFEIGDN